MTPTGFTASAADDGRAFSAGEALRSLRERWWVLVAAAIVAAVAAYVFTKLPWVEPRWKSSVWIEATGRFDYGNSLALQRQLRPLAERVRQLSVMREVDRNLRLDLPAEKMLAMTKAEPVEDSNQVRVDVEDADAARAERMALEIAAVYTEQHNSSQQAVLRQEQVILSVLDRSSAATLVWPQTRIILPAAALLGLLVAGAVVVLLSYLDDSIRGPADVERYLGLALIGVTPRLEAAPQRSANARALLPRTGTAGAVPAATATTVATRR